MLTLNHACMSTESFCPSGSWTRTPTPRGHYAVVASPGGNLYISSTECEPGYYCSAGEKRECAAGRFGAVRGLDSSLCSGVCKRGYFCDARSLNATAAACSTGPQRYCPEVRMDKFAPSWLFIQVCATADAVTRSCLLIVASCRVLRIQNW